MGGQCHRRRSTNSVRLPGRPLPPVVGDPAARGRPQGRGCPHAGRRVRHGADQHQDPHRGPHAPAPGQAGGPQPGPCRRSGPPTACRGRGRPARWDPPGGLTQPGNRGRWNHMEVAPRPPCGTSQGVLRRLFKGIGVGLGFSFTQFNPRSTSLSWPLQETQLARRPAQRGLIHTRVLPTHRAAAYRAHYATHCAHGARRASFSAKSFFK